MFYYILFSRQDLKMVITDPVDVKQMAEDELRWGEIIDAMNEAADEIEQWYWDI